MSYRTGDCSLSLAHCLYTVLVLFPAACCTQVIQMLRDVSTRKKTVAVCTDLRVRDRFEGVRRPTQVL